MRIRNCITWMTAVAGVALLGSGCADEATAPEEKPSLPTCTDFGRYIHVADSEPVADSAYRTAGRGDWLYCAAGTEGVYVVDASSGSDVSVVTAVPTSGDARDIVVAGAVAVVADGTAGVTTLSLADPASPSVIDNVVLAGAVAGIAVRGEYAYAADAGLGLRVIDIVQPDLAVVGSENTPGKPLDIDVSGTHAFLTDTILGLRIVSIADPRLPAFVTSLQIASGDVYGLALDGTIVYVAAGGLGIVVVDVADPANPTIRGEIPLPGGTRDVVVGGDRLFAADRYIGLWVLSRDDPLTSDPITLLATNDAALTVSAVGGHVVVGEGSTGFAFVDASNPNPPPLRSEIVVPGTGEGIFESGPAVYVCAGTEGIQVLDVSAGGQAQKVGDVPFDQTHVQHLAVGDRFAYAATGAGVDILDLADPFAPARRLGPRITVNRSAIQDSLLLIAGGGGGLAIYRIEAAGDVVSLGGVSTQGVAFDVVGFPGRAFVAASTSGLVEVRTVDPTQPVVRARLSLNGSALGAAAMDDYVIVAAGVGGIRVVDVSRPRFPSIVGTLALTGNAAYVAVDDRTGYIATRSGGVHVVDLTDATAPSLIGTMPMPDQTEAVLARRGLVLAADRSGTVRVALEQCK